jgi:hypothetical protein
MRQVVILTVSLSLSLLSSCVAPAEEADLSGEYIPAFEDTASGLEVTRAFGWYEQRGNSVWVAVDIQWSNTDASLASAPVRIQLPFAPADDFLQSASGSVRLQGVGSALPSFVHLDDRSEAAAPVDLGLSFEIFSGTLVVVGPEGAVGGEQVALAYGAGEQRVVASLTYIAAQ